MQLFKACFDPVSWEMNRSEINDNKEIWNRNANFGNAAGKYIFLSVVSATPNNTKEANAKYIVGSTEIIFNNHPDSNSTTLMITSNNSTNFYTVNVDKLDNTYRAKIDDVDGKLIKTKSYSSNPLLSSDGRAPAWDDDSFTVTVS